MTQDGVEADRLVVEVDVSEASQQALEDAVSTALRSHRSLVLRHTTELGYHAYGNHVLARAQDYARRRGLATSRTRSEVVMFPTHSRPAASVTAPFRPPDVVPTGVLRQSRGESPLVSTFSHTQNRN